MATMQPAEMSNEELRAAFARLGKERIKAAPTRQTVITRVCDAVLDAWLDRMTPG